MPTFITYSTTDSGSVRDAWAQIIPAMSVKIVVIVAQGGEMPCNLSVRKDGIMICFVQGR